MTNTETLTLVAILVGPVVAVVLTRYLDDRRDRRRGRMEVFKTLMRTRRTPVFVEHVGALNLIEIEFANDGKVIAAWRALFTHFGTEHPRRQEEQLLPALAKEQSTSRDQRFFDRLAKERQSLLAKLLHAMASAMNFKIEQLEIFEGGYCPQGWEDEFLEGQVMRRYVVDLALGRRPLPVAVIDYTERRASDDALGDRPPSRPPLNELSDR